MNINSDTQYKMDLRRLFLNQKFYLIVIILLIGIVTTIVNSRFLTISNFLIILQQISVLGIVTMAMGLLMISGGIDLSLGTLISLICVVMSIMIIKMNSPMALVLIVALLIGLASGAINGIIVSKSKSIPLIITLGTSFIFKGLALVFSGGHFMSLNYAFEEFNDLHPLGISIAVWVFVLMIVISYVILNRTRYGRRMVAIGGNEENAFLSGIRVDAYKISIYMLAGVYSTIAAIILAARLNSVTAAMGDKYGLQALAAVVVGGITFEGGKGTIGGAIIGCILLGLISNSMNMMRVSPHLQTATMGVIIVIAVVISNINKVRNN